METARAMNTGGLNQGSSGNVSLRLQDAMLITPSTLPYHRYTPEDMVELAWDGNTSKNVQGKGRKPFFTSYDMRYLHKVIVYDIGKMIGRHTH